MDRFEKDFLKGLSNAFIEESIEKLREINSEYNNNYKQQRELENQLSELKARLSERDKNFIEKYENNIFVIRAIEQSWLYLQGYRDCVKFLKLFRVI